MRRYGEYASFAHGENQNCCPTESFSCFPDSRKKFLQPLPGRESLTIIKLSARFTARWHAPGNPRCRRAHRIRAGSVRYAFLSKAGICLLQFEARTRAAGHSESRCALAHNKSWLLLRNKNNLVLPTSASTVFCRGGSPCPPARFQQR